MELKFKLLQVVNLFLKYSTHGKQKLIIMSYFSMWKLLIIWLLNKSKLSYVITAYQTRPIYTYNSSEIT
jgi:hypothetical protein